MTPCHYARLWSRRSRQNKLSRSILPKFACSALESLNASNNTNTSTHNTVILPSQIRKRNVPILALMSSTLLLVITSLVNIIVWAGDYRDIAPVWCDIYTTLQFSWPYAAAGAVLCICIHLEWITSLRSGVSSTPRRSLVEILLCLFPPLVGIPIRYTLATSRYVILEDLGCSMIFEFSGLWLALALVPYLLMATATAVFAGMAVRNFIRFRKITQHYDPQSTITKFHFVRMLVTCVTIGGWPLIATLLHFFVSNPAGKVTSWRGWASTHEYFQDIPQISSAHQSFKLIGCFIICMWMQILTAYIVSGALLCTDEVRGDLGMFGNYVVDKVSCQPCRDLSTRLKQPSSPSSRTQV